MLKIICSFDGEYDGDFAGNTIFWNYFGEKNWGRGRFSGPCYRSRTYTFSTKYLELTKNYRIFAAYSLTNSKITTTMDFGKLLLKLVGLAKDAATDYIENANKDSQPKPQSRPS